MRTWWTLRPPALLRDTDRMKRISWDDGRWTHSPEHTTITEQGNLVATAVEGSDAWLTTAYGFRHANAHALVAPLPVGGAMEVSFRADFPADFDQAGIYVDGGPLHWVKAGVEFADGHLGLGAVVTHEMSDWSVGFVDDWAGTEVTVRISRWADALIVRARSDDGPWRLVRVAPFTATLPLTAGPFLAAPTRAELSVEFTGWSEGPADAAIH